MSQSTAKGIVYPESTDNTRLWEHFKTMATTTDSALTAIQPQSAMKFADTSRASSTTQVADPDLALPVVAGATYQVEGYVVYSQNILASSTSGVVIGWSAPSLSTMTWTSHGTSGVTQTTTSDVTGQPISQTRQLPSNLGTPMTAAPRGALTVGSTSGTFAMTWAQVASSTTPTLVLAGSWLRLTRVA